MHLSEEEQQRVDLARAIFNGTSDITFHPSYYCTEEIERLLPEHDGITQYQLLDAEGKADIRTMYEQVVALRNSLAINYAQRAFTTLKQRNFTLENADCLRHPDVSTKLNDFRFSTGVLVPDDEMNVIKEIHDFTGLPYDDLLKQNNAEMTLFMEKERGYRETALTAFNMLTESRNPERTKAVLYECLAVIGADESIISHGSSAEEAKSMIDDKVKQGYLQLAFEEFEIIIGGSRTRHYSEVNNKSWAEREKNMQTSEQRLASILQEGTKQVTENNPQQAVERMNDYLQRGEATYADLAAYIMDKTEKSQTSLPRLTKTLKGKEGLDAEMAMTHLIARFMEKHTTTSPTR